MICTEVIGSTSRCGYVQRGVLEDRPVYEVLPSSLRPVLVS